MADKFSLEGKRKISAEQSNAPRKPRLPSDSSEDSWDTGSKAKMQKTSIMFPPTESNQDTHTYTHTQAHTHTHTHTHTHKSVRIK